MKNLTKALGIAGITALSFLPMKDAWGQTNDFVSLENKDVKLETKKENAEDNKQLYEDFEEFMKKKGYNVPDSEAYIFKKGCAEENDIIAMFQPDGGITLSLNFSEPNMEQFEDYGADGLNENDYFTKGFNPEKRIAEFSKEEQLKINKRYTNTLREILHNAKYKNY